MKTKSMDADSALETLGAGSVLPQIVEALNPQCMRSKLATVFSEHHGESVTVADLVAKVVRIKPGRRCLIQYELTYEHAGRRTKAKVIGKVRSRGTDRRTYELCCRLWRSRFGQAASDLVRVPQPLGVIPEYHMWLQHVVDAEPLQNQLAKEHCYDAFYAAGAALYKLHSCAPAPDRTHSRQNEMSVLANQLERLVAELRHYELRVSQILGACEDLIQSLPVCTPVPIHRDFYPDQLLHKSGAIWLLDLDLFSSGDPALDLGNFVAHLQESSLRRFGRCHHYSHLEQAFLEGYRDASGKALSLAVSAYTTLTLARHIAISRRNRARHHTTGALISICEGRLNLAGAGLSTAAHTFAGGTMAMPGWAVP